MKEALFYKSESDGKVRCFLCNHGCLIAPEQFGICRVRQNIKGVLYALNYGKVVAAHVDPIEKKPLYHFLPGSLSYSIAGAGCNFSCDFCQNWQMSQYAEAAKLRVPEHHVAAEDLVLEAARSQCKSVAYTYTEPTIFFEFAFECAVLARKKGLKNVFVTNGYMSDVALRYIAPHLDAANVDIKSFKETFYRSRCKARLTPVLDSVRLMKKLRIWVEITTLVIPGENDDPEEFKNLAEFIARVDAEMPWHISAFHPDYKLTDRPPTSRNSLEAAWRAGKKAGLKHIYLGNINAPERAATFCPACERELISRSGFFLRANRIKGGICEFCRAPVKGVWE